MCRKDDNNDEIKLALCYCFFCTIWHIKFSANLLYSFRKISNTCYRSVATVSPWLWSVTEYYSAMLSLPFRSVLNFLHLLVCFISTIVLYLNSTSISLINCSVTELWIHFNVQTVQRYFDPCLGLEEDLLNPYKEYQCTQLKLQWFISRTKIPTVTRKHVQLHMCEHNQFMCVEHIQKRQRTNRT